MVKVLDFTDQSGTECSYFILTLLILGGGAYFAKVYSPLYDIFNSLFSIPLFVSLFETIISYYSYEGNFKNLILPCKIQIHFHLNNFYENENSVSYTKLPP